MSLNFHIKAEEKIHKQAIDDLINESFGGEARKTRTVYQFRDGIDPIKDMGFVAISDDHGNGDHLLGTIRFWPVHLIINNKDLPQSITIPLLGPLAVVANLRGSGVGRALIQQGVDAIKQAGYPALFIVGDPGYYVPLGFNPDIVKHINLPGPVTPLTFMGLEFQDGFFLNHQGVLAKYRNQGDIS